MELCGVCIETDNAPRLAEFYKTVLQEKRLEGENELGVLYELSAVRSLESI